MHENRKYFQDHMPENICYGCGSNNKEGFRIKSYWLGELSCCEWRPQPKYQGWKNLLNGGVMATVVDCHCMCTAMADAYKSEQRSLDSEPEYRYATATMNLRYLKPVSVDALLFLEAKVTSRQGRKTTLHCQLKVDDVVCLEAEVIAVRVFDSSKIQPGSLFG